MGNLKYVYDTLKRKNPTAFITQGYLRSDLQLGSSNANLTFNFLANQTVVTAKCMPLQQADAFCVTAMSMKIYKSATDLTASNVAQTIDMNYPNVKVFSKSGEAGNLESLYNSYLQVTIQKRIVFSQYPAWKFRRVNTSQQSSQTGLIAGPIYSVVSAEEQAGVSNGLVALEPTINMQGGWTMSFTIVPPAALDLTGTSSVNCVSLLLDGFLLQNAASYNFVD